MKNRFFLLLCVAFSLLTCSLGYSQTGEEVPAAAGPKTIAIIKVKGNKAISSATILSKIKAKPGDVFSQELLNADLKRLFSLGFFTDISIETEDYERGLAVTFVVVEKPLISKIVFIGNKAFRSDKLKKEMKSAENEMQDETKLKRDMEYIKEMYSKKGYQLAEAKYATESDKEHNTVKITVTIDEKIRIKIRKIMFTGNKNMASKQLQRTMSTRADSLFTSGFFKEDTFQTDLDKIKTLYENSGYLDTKITYDIQYDKTGRWMDITIKVDEGKKYVVGDIILKGNIVFPEKEIRAKLLMVLAKPFSQTGLRQDILNIQQFYYQKGYMLAQVDGTSNMNPDTGKVDIIYTITENEVIYIDKIKIKGNVKTRDIVIRRELKSFPGERFDGDKLRRSKERLYNLGFFEEVTLDTVPGSAPNKEDLIVNVKETKTGEFSFGGGFSSVEHLIGFASITQKNFDLFNPPTFTGDGQQMRLMAEIGSITHNYELSWTEPWIFDYPVLFGFDLYSRDRSASGSLGYGYDERRTGGDLRLGKEFTDYLRGSAMLTAETVKIGGIDPNASTDLLAEEGINHLRKATLGLMQDTRDNVYNPKSGYTAGATFDGAGGFLGGTKDFTKEMLNGSVYFTHFEKLVLELKGFAGVANALHVNEKVPIYERYYCGGGNTVRGYRERHIGPKDPNTNDPIGGDAIVLGNAEYTVPLYEKVLKGAVFFDAGNVWEKEGDIGKGGLKYGTGVGTRINTPIGPVKLDYGWPLSKVEGERKTGRFTFSLSQGF